MGLLSSHLLHVGGGDIRGLVWDSISVQIDGTAAGATLIETINGDQKHEYSSLFGQAGANFDFYPFLAYMVVRSASNVTIFPTLSIGTNATAYNNIIPLSLLSGLSAIGRNTLLLAAGGAAIAFYGDSVYVNVTIPGIALLGSLVIDVNLVGCYQPAMT